MLSRGHVVAIPTETVYGLAASIAHPAAIEAIFSLKGRPHFNPLIVHLACQPDLRFHPMESLSAYIEQPLEGLEQLVQHFWPGPLTLVLPVGTSSMISPLARANLPTAAFRMPLHPIAQRILSQTGPLVAPSANRSGTPSSTCVEHVEADFGPLFPVVDGGRCQSGVESTILMRHEGRWRIGRLGAIAPETFAPLLGYVPEWSALTGKAGVAEAGEAGEAGAIGEIRCPGQLYRHYAPCAKLILGETEYDECHPVVLGFTDRDYIGAKRIFCLSSSDDPVGSLNVLYDVLRELDQQRISSAWIDLRMPETGLWRTLRERLIRAAGC